MKVTLKKEITLFMFAIVVSAFLFLVLAFAYVFFIFFAQDTKEDIEYVVSSTSKIYDSHIQFIEDGAVAIRHNVVLDDFFEGKAYDENLIESQLSYSIKLFSERNMVDKYIPFVTSIYLFNNDGDCVWERYYASTLSSQTNKERYYKMLRDDFCLVGKQYIVKDLGDSINLFFRIYDEKMLEKGICIVEINKEAIEEILTRIRAYKDSAYSISFGDNILLGYGEEKYLKELLENKKEFIGVRDINANRMIVCTQNIAFNMRAIILVGNNNIYNSLKPTLIIFVTIFFVLFLFTFIIAFITSRRITSPLVKMTDSIREFGKEDFDLRLIGSDIVEINDISTVFNEMADRIEYLVTQVYEKELIATRTQMKFLQAQINPHFQFNILAMFSLKAKMAGNEDLYEGLRTYSKLMQGKIFRRKEIKITIKEELEIVRFYLSLQKSRYGDKISYEFNIEEGLSNALIPRLLIEPLVENAVSHGLENKKDDGTVKVSVFKSFDFLKFSKDSAMLHICVEDDGIGFDVDEVFVSNKEISEFHTHTGLANMKHMLEVMYDDMQEIKITGEKGKGTKIEVIVPLEEGDKYVAD